jgi:hypothetical protein
MRKNHKNINREVAMEYENDEEGKAHRTRTVRGGKGRLVGAPQM